MEEIEVKQELNNDSQSQCYACLSVGRKMLPLDECFHVYKQLTSQFIDSINIYSDLCAVCWECHALLRRVVQFQYQVRRANELLLSRQNFLCGSLSNLTSVVIQDKNLKTIYFSDTDIKTDTTILAEKLIESFKQYDSDSSHDNTCYKDIHSQNTDLNTDAIKKEIKEHTKKKVKNSIWGKKRVLENKKPKFKIFTPDLVNFRKVSFSIEEAMKCLEQERNSLLYTSKMYKCENCVLGFTDRAALMRHNERFHMKDIGQYVCDICQSRFSVKRHLSLHIKNHYYKYECTLCEYSCYVNKRARHAHARVKHRKNYQCVKCDVLFSGRREFFSHYKQWHRKFICDTCGVCFRMRYSLIDHLRKQHKPIRCEPCNKTFTRANGLWMHKKLAHGAPAQRQPAYCVECDKRFEDVFRYKLHLASSARHRPTKKRSIPCPSCDKVFTKNIYMKDHYDLVHLKFFKFRCEECDKNFLRNASLVNHRRRVHEGIPPARNKICYLCGKGFSTNKILSNHLRTHTGERPFLCGACPARFSQQVALVSHTRNIHGKRKNK